MTSNFSQVWKFSAVATRNVALPVAVVSAISMAVSEGSMPT